MSDFKVVLPTTTEEWQRDMKLAYNKAIDDFAERLCYKIKLEIDDCADELQWVDEIAERLKAGNINESN